MHYSYGYLGFLIDVLIIIISIEQLELGKSRALIARIINIIIAINVCYVLFWFVWYLIEYIDYFNHFLCRMGPILVLFSRWNFRISSLQIIKTKKKRKWKLKNICLKYFNKKKASIIRVPP